MFRRVLLFGLTIAGPVAAQGLPAVIHPEGRAEVDGAVARRAQDGFFHFGVQVNGAALPMVFDSGASLVALRYEDAGRAGVDVEALRFTVPIGTPNGRTVAAGVVLRELTVGAITRRDVPAIVGRPGAMGVNLLGQSFLARLGGFRQEGERLVLLDGR